MSRQGPAVGRGSSVASLRPRDLTDIEKLEEIRGGCSAAAGARSTHRPAQVRLLPVSTPTGLVVAPRDERAASGDRPRNVPHRRWGRRTGSCSWSSWETSVKAVLVGNSTAWHLRVFLADAEYSRPPCFASFECCSVPSRLLSRPVASWPLRIWLYAISSQSFRLPPSQVVPRRGSQNAPGKHRKPAELASLPAGSVSDRDRDHRHRGTDWGRSGCRRPWRRSGPALRLDGGYMLLSD